MAESGVEHFLEGHDDQGRPRTRDFHVADGAAVSAPETTLRHHRPIGQKRITIDLETDVTLDNGAEPDAEQDQDPSCGFSLKALRVGLKRGLRRRSTHMKIRVEYEARDTPEAIERLHEELLDNWDTNGGGTDA